MRVSPVCHTIACFYGYRANEVTLGDFKAAFGRHGDFRFFFKTEDPDCGVVKEEVCALSHLILIKAPVCHS